MRRPWRSSSSALSVAAAPERRSGTTAGPPTRTLKVPFSFACQVMAVDPVPVSKVGFAPSICTVGAVVSFVTLVVVEPVFRRIRDADSNRVGAVGEQPGSDARRDRGRLRRVATACGSHAADAVARLPPAPWKEPLSRSRATSHRRVPGSVRVGKMESIVTVGAAVSFVTVLVCEPVLPAASLTHTRSVFAPAASDDALTEVETVAGAPV